MYKDACFHAECIWANKATYLTLRALASIAKRILNRCLVVYIDDALMGNIKQCFYGSLLLDQLFHCCTIIYVNVKLRGVNVNKLIYYSILYVGNNKIVVKAQLVKGGFIPSSSE